MTRPAYGAEHVIWADEIQDRRLPYRVGHHSAEQRLLRAYDRAAAV